MLLQATSLISGEHPISGNSTTGISGRENSAPQSGKSGDNLVRNKHGETGKKIGRNRTIISQSKIVKNEEKNEEEYLEISYVLLRV